MDPRSLEGKKLIDSLEALAEKLVAYVANTSNVPALTEAIKTSKQKYKDTYWGLGWLYSYFRRRGPSADQLKADLEESGDAKTLLPPLLHFLAQGGKETTSLNTEFLYDLIDKFMTNGEYVDTSARSGMTHSELKRLHELFLKQSRELLDKDTPEAIYEKLQSERSEELKAWSRKSTEAKPEESEARSRQLAGAMMTNVLQELLDRVHKRNGAVADETAERVSMKQSADGNNMRTLAELRKEWLDNEERRRAKEQAEVEKRFADQRKVGRVNVDRMMLVNKDGKNVSLLDHLNSRYGTSAATDKRPEPKKLDVNNYPIAQLFGHREKDPVPAGKLDMTKFAHLNSIFAKPDAVQKAHEGQLEALQKHEAEGQQQQDASVAVKSI